MPSAVVLSILIHAGLFLLAGMLVVFTVVKKEEQKFEPPKAVDRPKMKLKKPKVKIKKTSKPKPTARIVTKIDRASLPDIQLPEMSDMDTGLGDMVGGFDMMPDFNETILLGGSRTIGNDFVGTFYDFKRDRSGRTIPMSPETYAAELTKFVRRGWKASYLEKFYQSPKKLYTTSFMMGTLLSTLGPKAFGEETGGWSWLAHYKGQLVYPEDIKFRFWGLGNDILLVRVDGQLVLNGNWHRGDGAHMYITDIGGSWDSTSSDDARYYYGRNKARVGDWIELKAGEPLDMEVMIGEPAGGYFSAMLTVQVEGVEYERNRQGGPILPMFKTSEPSRNLQDAIYRDLIRGEVAVTNGPVFRDYVMKQNVSQLEEAEGAGASVKEMVPESKMRSWSCYADRELEAELVSVIGDKVVLKTSRGKQVKIPLAKLSPVDREYLELANPPEFSIDFVKLSDSKLSRYEMSPSEMRWGRDPPRVNDFTFGAKVKQRGAGRYHQELTVEYFAIGKERIGNKYILLDRKSSSFTPTKENGRSHGFKGEPTEFVEYNVDEDVRGNRPDGNVVIITDARGRIIQHSASKSWLWENIENLKNLPVGAYMDKTCTRTYPTSPKPVMW